MNHFSRVIDRSEPDGKLHHTEWLRRHFAFYSSAHLLISLPLGIRASLALTAWQPSSHHPSHATDTRHLVPLPSLWPFSLSYHTWNMLTALLWPTVPYFLPLRTSPVSSTPAHPLLFRREQTKLPIISVVQPTCCGLIKGAASGLCVHRQPLG